MSGPATAACRRFDERLLERLETDPGWALDPPSPDALLGPSKVKPTVRTVDAVIRKLVARLGDVAGSPTVEPVLGTGYRWALPIRVE